MGFAKLIVVRSSIEIAARCARTRGQPLHVARPVAAGRRLCDSNFWRRAPRSACVRSPADRYPRIRPWIRRPGSRRPSRAAQRPRSPRADARREFPRLSRRVPPRRRFSSGDDDLKTLIVVVVLLSVILGVDARSPRKTEKLYRKAGKWQRKLRDVWALLGVKPFLVQPGEEGDECVLKSKITVDDAADKDDYMLKSTVETEYVLKGADVFTQADIDAALQAADAAAATEKAAALAAKDDEIAANYKSNEVVEANYVLKTCGFPPTGVSSRRG